MEIQPFIKVFIFEGDQLVEPCPMPQWRIDEIERAHPFDKRDKDLIWRALTIAVNKAFGVTLESLNPRKDYLGKLYIDNYHVSLSHSGNRFMVGLSSHNIGVDIMKNSEYRYYALSENKSYWSKDEQKIIYAKDEIAPFYITWCKKEALYKFLNPGFPYKENKARVDTTKYKSMFRIGSLEREYHFFAICSELFKEQVKPQLFTNLELD